MQEKLLTSVCTKYRSRSQDEVAEVNAGTLSLARRVTDAEFKVKLDTERANYLAVVKRLH